MSFSWQNLKQPFWCLAPMEGVTDTVFRQIIAQIGKPDVFFTEFTSVDGLFSKGYAFVKDRLEYGEEEKPLIAQIWGLEPESFYKGAKMMVEKGFDGIDINMGCPDKAVIKSGACSALINNKLLVSKIIKATKEGSGDKLPVSIKIRTGFAMPDTKNWVRFILDHGVDALTIHGRTTKQLSKVPADWGEIKKAVQVRDELMVNTVIIGNGDVSNINEAREKAALFGVEGVMFGRAIFKDPWLFNSVKNIQTVSKQEKIEVLYKHVMLFSETWGESKSFQTLKKFVKVYIDGFRGAKLLRIALMETESYEEFMDILDKQLL